MKNCTATYNILFLFSVGQELELPCLLCTYLSYELCQCIGYKISFTKDKDKLEIGAHPELNIPNS